jgi:histidinol-phosphate phosphatase family protein
MSREHDPNRSAPVDYTVVIPTIGRAGLADLVAGIDSEPRARAIVVVDDRRDPTSPLALPATATPLRVLRSGGRGPAAARNVGWRAADSEWVAFLDDDVEPTVDWNAQLARDLEGLPESVAGSQAQLHVPLPADRRPTDEERRTSCLVGAPWITADMAYRRSALLTTGGFDERFPRAFREDSDLALRVVRAGSTIAWGRRSTTHPLVARGGWRGVLRAQAGNADNALLRAKYGPGWRRLTKAGGGRTGLHLATCGAAAAAGVGLLTGRRWTAQVAAAVWAGLTAEFAVRRILPGPRTAREVAAMVLTSALIPPLAIWHRLRGELRWGVIGARWPGRSDSRPLAVLFDRDGTLMHNVPYLSDPDLVRPVAGARRSLAALRSKGIAVGVVSNQSGVARGLISDKALEQVNAKVEDLLGPFDTWQICRHGTDDGCDCRKPEPGMVHAAARELGVRPSDCVLIGDTGADVDAALRAGARAVLVPTAETLLPEVDRAGVLAEVAPNLTVAVRRSLRGWT